MDIIYNFLADYYVIFGIASIFFLLSLIGIISSRPKTIKEEDPSSQPIKMEEEINPTIDSMTTTSNQVNNSYPQVNNNQTEFIEPSLDGLESTATEVKINTELNNNEMFVINDSQSSQDINFDSTSVIEEPKYDNGIENMSGGMLIIEDTSSSEDDASGVPTSKQVKNEEEQQSSGELLIVEDLSTLNNEASNVPVSKQVQKENEERLLQEQQSQTQVNNEAEQVQKSIFEE